MDSKTKFLLPFALIVATLAVSTASIFIRFAQGDGAPSLVIAALRMLLSTLILAPYALMSHFDEIKRLTRTEILLGGLSGIFLAAHFATWISSLEYTSVASSVVFVGTGPLWVALVSPFLLKETFSRFTILGLILAVFGGMVIGLADACSWQGLLSCPSMEDILHGRAMWGNFLALLGAWAVTGYLIIGRKLRTTISLIPYIFLVYGMAAIALLILLPFTENTIFGYDSKTYIWIFLLAIIPQVIGHSTYNWALKYLKATLVAATVLGEPVGSIILAYLLLDEIPNTAKIAGGILILTGIIIAGRNS